MQWNILFFFNSVLLGVGLAMDAFSVSLANGLNEPRMSRRRMLGIAGVFAAFQALMPMTGWVCVHTIVQYFRAFEKLIPWIALALLGFIGGKMLIEGIRGGGGDEDTAPRLGPGAPCWCRGWPRPSTLYPWASPLPSMTGSWPWSVP
ncbi:MAG: manganese efflux pump MntP family protein [Oscillospiraceae bacterium]